MTTIKDSLRGEKRKRVLDVAVEQLRIAIENGEINVGEKLPSMDELCEIMNMGRSSIREALRILEIEGLIEIKQGTGTFVTQRDSWYPSRSSVVQLIKRRGESLIQLLQIRQCLEGMAAAQAAKLKTPALISELSEIVDALDKMAEKDAYEVDLDEVAKLNNRFHFAISRAAGNTLAHEIILHILPSFTESNKALLYAGQSLKRQAAEHLALLAAIESGDAVQAQQLMTNHIGRIIDEIENLTEE